ncbi:MAG TPA: PqiC family protein, partial [Candidatus Binatia bacterium]|nr:PqiC family protein [Candidatus Binatia bacterium]
MMRIVLPVLVVVLATGCSLLAPEPDRSRFFVLAADVGAPTPAPGERELMIGVGPVTIPGYLDRNEMATRLSSEELRYSTLERWAEPLGEGIERVMSENLIALLPDDLVLRFPWLVTAPVDYQVQLGVRRFEADQQGTAELAVRWTIREPRTGRYRVARESVLHAAGSGTDPDIAVRALSSTL